jgi:hypothetical protein
MGGVGGWEGEMRGIIEVGGETMGIACGMLGNGVTYEAEIGYKCKDKLID